MIQYLFIVIIIILICNCIFKRKKHRRPVYSCASYFDGKNAAAPSVATPTQPPLSSDTLDPSESGYHDFLINTGLNKDVIDSHRDYTADMQTTTTGASTETVFSHSDDIVPYWGLRRHGPHIPIDDTSREVPTLTNEQLAENSRPMKYGFF